MSLKTLCKVASLLQQLNLNNSGTSHDHTQNDRFIYSFTCYHFYFSIC
ncbi:hypothetical protein VCRA2123O444_80045 [Vibrio crassostreae]|nr:hypothetical protein VCRA2113O416_100046 [Vibrio crassostreae]CAK1696246.1 hypothetical protein VCRA2117O428_100046 [Vibrio crassostreae]CAK1843094.1 hypothetical protein VCRA2110O182_10317 [Vibrio crassostreae]CAK1877382.1 hypothetical protein VCRA2118O429_10480 [Vibrio crassostreae]CAK1979186.1 hypothetical protein VCRA2114O421_20119 [Vibrio crassostreae]